METNLWEAATRLEPLEPAFVSVTYGAGGTTRERTHATVARIVRETDDEARRASDLRRRLRAPRSARRCAPITARACATSSRCAAIRRPASTRLTKRRPTATSRRPISSPTPSAIGDFEVSVSTYPEKHPQSPTLLHDIEMLKRKVDAGADRAITQFFFDNSVYFRFLDVAAAAGITIPIVPGIFPVQNFKQTANFARRTGASVPQWLADRFEGLEDDPATRRLVAAAVCAEQVIDLIDHGVEELHFYTMNRADLVFAICHLIGLRAASRRRSRFPRIEREPPPLAAGAL